MPGQHSQPTPTLLGQGCLCIKVQCNLPPVLLAKWLGSFMCHCGNIGWNGHRIRVSTESLLWRTKFSCPSRRDLNLQPLNHESRALPASYHCTEIRHKHTSQPLDCWNNTQTWQRNNSGIQIKTMLGYDFFSHSFAILVYHFSMATAGATFSCTQNDIVLSCS